MFMQLQSMSPVPSPPEWCAVFQTLQFLEGTPCKYQSEECIREFILAVAKYNLTKSEKLQLLNTRPTSAVEIQLVSVRRQQVAQSGVVRSGVANSVTGCSGETDRPWGGEGGVSH